VIPIRDVESLKLRLLELYQDKEKAREMGRLARSSVAESYTWDAYGDRVHSAYLEMTN